MNRDDVIVMAEKSGFQRHEIDSKLEEFEYFANLVAAAEREACVKVVQEWLHGDWHNAGVVAVTMIRERGAP
jgi:hypothetical protein